MKKAGAALSISLFLSACSPVSLLSETEKNKFPYSFVSQSADFPQEKPYKQAIASNYDENNQIRKENWESSYKVASDSVNEKIKEHLEFRKDYETKSDFWNVPILGSVVAIAGSALFKASSQSIGGLAIGAGGLTAGREYFNVEEKRDLHRDTAIGLVCLRTEAIRMKSLAPSMTNIFASVDTLKDKIGQAISDQSELNFSGQAKPEVATLMATAIATAHGVEAEANRNIAQYSDFPYAILGAADKLQAKILTDGGRGTVQSGAINDQIYSRMTDAAVSTQKIAELRVKIAEAKDRNYVFTPPTTTPDGKPATLALTTQLTARASASYNGLTLATMAVMDGLSGLGENEMSKVGKRIAECGNRGEKSGG